MSAMNERNVTLGEIALNGESIVLRAEIAGPMPAARVALVKDKLSYILDTRFKPAPPPESERLSAPIYSLYLRRTGACP